MRDTLLLACGSHSSRAMLRTIFDENYNLLEAETGKQATLLLEQNLNCIAALLLDLTVPNKGGHTLLKTVKAKKQLAEVPLLVILDEHSQIDEATAFTLGADDVIVQPCDPLVTYSRVQTIVDLNRHRWHLQELLNEQADILRHSNEVMVDALSSIIEYRSVESGQHILRIRRFTKILLEEVARSCPEYNLNDTTIGIITSAAALHDIGKISIPDSILNKPGRLTEEEWEVMRTHALTGCRILESLSGTGNKEYLRYAHNICHYHHERWDGKGYPEGIAGDDIPICAQVVGLADAYDALTSTRIYKEAFSFSRAVNMILGGECGQFSPKLLECFKQVSPSMAALAREYADGHSPKSDDITVPLPGPSFQTQNDTLHMTQMRYHALMHHMDATVAEADLDQGVFHLVYNADQNLTPLQSGRDFAEVADILMKRLVVPEDRDTLRDILTQRIPKFLRDGLRKQAYFLRLGTDSQFIQYKVTLLRLNLNDASSHKLLILWEKDRPAEGSAAPEQDNLSSHSIFKSIAGFTCCQHDRFLTLAHFGDSLTHILGYTEEDILTQFHGQFLELIEPEDRDKVLRSTAEQLTHSAYAETEYRLRHRNGTVIWVTSKSRLITASDGTEYLYSILLDITQTKAAQEELLQTLERHQIILSQTQNVVFEWDIATDSIRYFGDWYSIFGYEPMKDNLVAQLDTDSHFHPEDIPAFRSMFQALCSGTSYQVAEFRLANAEGRYLWCRFRATACYDGQEQPQRVVGLIINIDAEKRASQNLQSQAERDSLTKLLNKDAARKYCEEYLSSGNAVGAALLIIDLDNFKLVNDRHGHLFGDAVLTQTAAQLRKLFRSDDVVARIGGDEFMVLMKGNPSPTLVQERCRRLVNIFRRTLQELVPDCALSCSIGVSMSPEHGTTYTELFSRADQALYQAKAAGKNSFRFYDKKETALLSLQRAVSAVNARIDSDEQQPNLAENSLIRYAFQRLYDSGDVVEAVEHILRVVGQQMNVSRVYIFENSADNKTCSNTFEWCNEGITPEIDSLQLVSYETDIPHYEDNFNEQGIFYCPDVSKLPKNVYDILEPQGIKSMLQCAIRDNGVFRGYVGFDECSETRLWTNEQIDALTLCAEMISVFLLKKRAQDETALYASDLASVLDNQNAWIYVIDPVNCTLKFLNAKTRALAPNAKPGMKCHECLMGLPSRCPGCPALGIHEKKTNQVNLDNFYLGLSVEAESTLISWGGKEACLLTCRELKK